MKKLMMIGFLFQMVLACSQCVINGKSPIAVGEEQNYTVSGETAQCKECHLWLLVGNNTTISGDNKLNFVKLRANASGRQVISLAMLTPQGLAQCSKNIEIYAGNTPEITQPVLQTVAPQTTTVTCDIQLSNYKEVKYDSGMVSFFPEVAGGDYKYSWTVTRVNGEIAKSTEKVPQFSYSAENGIKTVKLQVSSAKCMKEFSKVYDGSYWKYFP